MASTITLRAGVHGSVSAVVTEIEGRPAVVVEIDPDIKRGALSETDGHTIAAAARVALHERIPLVAHIASSGADVADGVAALVGWGNAGPRAGALLGRGADRPRGQRAGGVRSGPAARVGRLRDHDPGGLRLRLRTRGWSLRSPASSLSAFAKAFAGLTGESPTGFRRRAAEQGTALDQP